MSSAADEQNGELERSTIKRISTRLMPLLGLIYMVAYIDRQNVSYAKLQMVGDLGLSEAAYGLGAALFFIGYFLFEVPSNLLLERVGARLWFARIMASWGAATILLGFTSSPTMFYILRFVLGLAEAGFFPGVLYVLTLWFPQSYRARSRLLHAGQRRCQCRWRGNRRRAPRLRRHASPQRVAVGLPCNGRSRRAARPGGTATAAEPA
jgi:sugar phosphate permease